MTGAAERRRQRPNWMSHGGSRIRAMNRSSASRRRSSSLVADLRGRIPVDGGAVGERRGDVEQRSLSITLQLFGQAHERSGRRHARGIPRRLLESLGDLLVCQSQLHPRHDQVAFVLAEPGHRRIVAIELLLTDRGLERRGAILGDSLVEVLNRRLPSPCFGTRSEFGSSLPGAGTPVSAPSPRGSNASTRLNT